MTWNSPSWIDIRMDAEIGSYQNDFDGEDNRALAEEQAADVPRATDVE